MVESHGGGESGEPGGHSLDTLKLTILDDLGAEAVSLGVALPATSPPMSCTTKFYSK
jgi:hypothetical protein